MFDVGLPPVAELKLERRFFNIMNCIKNLQARVSALMVALLMVFSMASGILSPAGGGFALAPTAVLGFQAGYVCWQPPDSPGCNFRHSVLRHRPHSVRRRLGRGQLLLEPAFRSSCLSNNFNPTNGRRETAAQFPSQTQ